VRIRFAKQKKQSFQSLYFLFFKPFTML